MNRPKDKGETHRFYGQRPDGEMELVAEIRLVRTKEQLEETRREIAAAVVTGNTMDAPRILPPEIEPGQTILIGVLKEGLHVAGAPFGLLNDDNTVRLAVECYKDPKSQTQSFYPVVFIMTDLPSLGGERMVLIIKDTERKPALRRSRTPDGHTLN